MFQKHFRSGFRKEKKENAYIFKENRVSTKVECNLAMTNFLEVTFDLESHTYYP